jgi:hypothetical protein
MPLIVVRTVMTASGTATPLSGNQYEYLPFDAFVEIAVQASATGVLATVYSGSDVLMEEGPTQIGTINVSPKYPDDFFLHDEAVAGDRLSVRLRETAAGTPTVMTSVKITAM